MACESILLEQQMRHDLTIAIDPNADNTAMQQSPAADE
jgi:hypothetical protein